MNPVQTVRKIRACEGEAAAQLLLEMFAEDRCTALLATLKAIANCSDLEMADGDGARKMVAEAIAAHDAGPEHPRDRVRQAILDMLAAVPRPGTAAADLNEAERMALVVAAGAPYKTVMDGNMMRLQTTVPVGIADRPGGGYFVAIGAPERPGDTVKSVL
jgi:hypothetical protein